MVRPWPISSILLSLFGAALAAMGLYFMLVRPALLPEDLRYIAQSTAQLDASAPRLTSWLLLVFRAMGGYGLATGVLTITLAATSFRARHSGAAAGVLIAGVASIGWMVAVNFVIDSDYRWLVLGIALLWASSLALFWLEKKPRQVS